MSKSNDRNQHRRVPLLQGFAPQLSEKTRITPRVIPWNMAIPKWQATGPSGGQQGSLARPFSGRCWRSLVDSLLELVKGVKKLCTILENEGGNLEKTQLLPFQVWWLKGNLAKLFAGLAKGNSSQCFCRETSRFLWPVQPTPGTNPPGKHQPPSLSTTDHPLDMINS